MEVDAVEGLATVEQLQNRRMPEKMTHRMEGYRKLVRRLPPFLVRVLMFTVVCDTLLSSETVMRATMMS